MHITPTTTLTLTHIPAHTHTNANLVVSCAEYTMHGKTVVTMVNGLAAFSDLTLDMPPAGDYYFDFTTSIVLEGTKYQTLSNHSNSC